MSVEILWGYDGMKHIAKLGVNELHIAYFVHH